MTAGLQELEKIWTEGKCMPDVRARGGQGMWRRRSCGEVVLALVFVLSVGAFLWGGRSDGRYGDFAPVYGSARCILSGCDPYSLPEVKAELLAHGMNPDHTGPEYWKDHALLYPPLTYYLFAPIAFLSYPAAGLVTFWISAGAFIAACLMTILLCPPIARRVVVVGVSAVLVTSGGLLRLGQPSTLVLGLLVAGSLLFLDRRHPRYAAVLFLMAAGVKPQLVLPVLIYFCLTRATRKHALAALAGFVVASAAAGVALACQPGSDHWVSELRAEVSAAVPAGPEARIDTGIVNLEGFTSLVSGNPLIYETVDWIVFAALMVMLGMGFFRAQAGWERDWVGVAALAFLTLLLTYHRSYDMRIQILSFPALGMLWRRSRKLAGAISVLNCLLLFSTSIILLRGLVAHFGSAIEHRLWFRLFIERQQAVAVLLAALLWAFASVAVKWQGNEARWTRASGDQAAE